MTIRDKKMCSSDYEAATVLLGKSSGESLKDTRLSAHGSNLALCFPKP